jgi:hypothetical protein
MKDYQQIDRPEAKGLKSVTVQQKLTYGLLIFLAILLLSPALLGYLIYLNVTAVVENVWAGDMVRLKFFFGAISFESILTIYNLTATAIGIVSSSGIILFCAETLKNKAMDMIMKKSSTRLDKIVEEHCSVVANNPAIVFFTNSRTASSGFICSMIYLIGFVITAYKNGNPNPNL